MLVGAAIWGVSAWLLQDLSTLPAAEQVSARIEAVRTALAAGAGVGAAVTLLLAVRRQRHQELATAHTTHDAAERRVTELYTKAVEQLGNAQAPVRLAGLYALERLAQDTPALRQTIVDVICSYLRMPYTLPREDRGEKIRAAQRAAREPARLITGGGRDPQEERQVRLTAQRILTAHLRYGDSPAPRRRWPSRHLDHNTRHWHGIRLDLTGAVLIDFDLSTCYMGTAEFGGATFTGDARFDRATFTGDARFDRATFTGDARFDQAVFTDSARFDRATFTGTALFRGVNFAGPILFGGSIFTKDAGFGGSIFTKVAEFGGSTCTGTVGFARVTFTGTAGFRAVNFRIAFFDRATFTGTAEFSEATFRIARFVRVTFTGAAMFRRATFIRRGLFEEATFADAAAFDEASGLEGAAVAGVRIAPVAADVQRVWPRCWRVEVTADGWQTLRVVGAEDGGSQADGETRP